MVMPEYSNIAFELDNFYFAEIRKTAEGVIKAQAFLIDIVKYSRFVATKSGREDTKSAFH